MGGTTSQTQTNEPPEWAEPLFRQSADVAQRLFDSGSGFNTWQGTTVAQPSSSTLLGMQALQAAGLAGMGLGSMPNINVGNWGATNSWNGGGANSRTPNQMQPMQMMASGWGGVGAPQYSAPNQVMMRGASNSGGEGRPGDDNYYPGDDFGDRGPDNRGDPNDKGDKDDDKPVEPVEPPRESFTPLQFQGPSPEMIAAQAGAQGLTQLPIGMFNNVLMHGGLSPEALAASGLFQQGMTGELNPDTSNRQTHSANQLFGQMGRGAYDTNTADMLRRMIVGSPLSSQENTALGNIRGIASGSNNTADVGWGQLQDILTGRDDIGTNRLENLGQAAQNNPYSGRMLNAAGDAGQSAAIGDRFLQDMQQGRLDVSSDPLTDLANRALNNPYADDMTDAARAVGQSANTGDTTLRNIQVGKNEIGTADEFQRIYNQALNGKSAADKYLTGMASGDMLDGNPYLDQLLDNQAAGISDALAAQFGASGRYGSGAHQDLLAKNIADMRLQGMFDNYNAERGHQMSAIQQLQAAQEAGRGQALAAQQGRTGVQAQNIGNQMAAATARQQAELAAGMGQASIFDQLFGQSSTGLGQALGAQQTAIGNEQQNLQNRFGAVDQRQGAALDAANSQANIVNQLFGQRSTGLGQAMDAANSVAGIQGQNIGNQMAAANAQRGALNQDIQNILGASGMQAQIGSAGQDRLMDAIRGIQSADQFNAGNALNAAQGLAGQGQNLFQNQQQNLQNQFGAANAAANIGQGGLEQALSYINALPTIQQNRVFDANLLMQAGSMEDQMNQGLLNDAIRRFYENDMNEWTRLGALQAAAGGSAGPYGTQHTAMSQPFNPMSMMGLMAPMMGKV